MYICTSLQQGIKFIRHSIQFACLGVFCTGTVDIKQLTIGGSRRKLVPLDGELFIPIFFFSSTPFPWINWEETFACPLLSKTSRIRPWNGLNRCGSRIITPLSVSQVLNSHSHVMYILSILLAKYHPYLRRDASLSFKLLRHGTLNLHWPVFQRER